MTKALVHIKRNQDQRGMSQAKRCNNVHKRVQRQDMLIQQQRYHQQSYLKLKEDTEYRINFTSIYNFTEDRENNEDG